MTKLTRPTWNATPGTLITGESYITEADKAANQAEAKWGRGRLRILVSRELREKFDRQRFLFNSAIWHGDLEAVRRESERMTLAWKALDKAATTAGARKPGPETWETTLEDGTVIAIAFDDDAAHDMARDERKVTVYTLEEIGRFLAAYPGVAKAKAVWPGATVEQIRKISDPLDSIRDAVTLDDDLNDPIPLFGA